MGWLLWIPGRALIEAIEFVVKSCVLAISNLPNFLVSSCVGILRILHYERVLRVLEISTWISVGSVFFLAKNPGILDNLREILVSLGVNKPRECHSTGETASVTVPLVLKQLYDLLPVIIPPIVSEQEGSASSITRSATPRNETLRAAQPRNPVTDPALLRRSLPEIPTEGNRNESEAHVVQRLSDMLNPSENLEWMSMSGHSQAPPEYEDDEALPPFRSVSGTIRSTFGR